MGEREERGKSEKCTRKLDYNAPFLSTRYPSGGATRSQLSRASSRGAWRDTSNRVPFSWEQVPGKPKKDLEKCDPNEMNLPPPKPPPGRWHQSEETIRVDNRDHCRVDRDDNEDDDEASDGDHVDDDDDDDQEVFSDAIDMFSLCESMDFNTADGLGGVDSETEERRRGAHSPSFIIQRFLPDAAALAASSSALAISKNLNGKLPQSSNYRRRSYVSQPYPSPKGCGLDIFFPWSLKHKPCALKSPVRKPSLNAKSQCSTRR